MSKTKNYLAAGALLCSAVLGVNAMSETTHAVSAESLNAVNTVLNSMRPIYQTAVDDYNAANPDQTQLQLADVDYPTPYYKPATVNAYAQLGLAYGFETQTTDGIPASLFTTTEVYDQAIEKLTDLGFSTYGPAYTFPPTQQYFNEGTGVICAVVWDGSSLTCGHTNWQTITDEWTDFLNGIGAAYYESEGQYPVVRGDISDDSALPTIHDSDYAPYQYTFVPISNFMGMFYRASSTSDWVYFAGTQSALDCSAYTGEAEKGFMGLICYNGTEESKVGAVAASQEEESSAVATPDTGAPTSDNRGAIAAISATALVAVATLIYLANYTKNRFASKVHFGKK